MPDNDSNQSTGVTSSTPDIDILRAQITPPGALQNVPENPTPNTAEEVQSFSTRSLQEDAASQDHERDQKWKNHFSKAFICAFWLLWFLFIIMILFLIYHWVTPNSMHWLNTEQLERIQTLIIAALASKAITNKVEKT